MTRKGAPLLSVCLTMNLCREYKVSILRTYLWMSIQVKYFHAMNEHLTDCKGGTALWLDSLVFFTRFNKTGNDFVWPLAWNLFFSDVFSQLHALLNMSSTLFLEVGTCSWSLYAVTGKSDSKSMVVQLLRIFGSWMTQFEIPYTLLKA